MEKIQAREENQALREAWDFVEHTGRSIFLTGNLFRLYLGFL